MSKFTLLTHILEICLEFLNGAKTSGQRVMTLRQRLCGLPGPRHRDEVFLGHKPGQEAHKKWDQAQTDEEYYYKSAKWKTKADFTEHRG